MNETIPISSSGGIMVNIRLLYSSMSASICKTIHFNNLMGCIEYEGSFFKMSHKALGQKTFICMIIVELSWDAL